MNKEIIKEQYMSLRESIYTSYNGIKVIDNYDFYTSNPYTIFYLNKKEDFNEFAKLWNKVVSDCNKHDYDYDDILWEFEKQATDKFDYIELGTLDIYTDKTYKLEI